MFLCLQKRLPELLFFWGEGGRSPPHSGFLWQVAIQVVQGFISDLRLASPSRNIFSSATATCSQAMRAQKPFLCRKKTPKHQWENLSAWGDRTYFSILVCNLQLHHSAHVGPSWIYCWWWKKSGGLTSWGWFVYPMILWVLKKNWELDAIVSRNPANQLRHVKKPCKWRDVCLFVPGSKTPYIGHGHPTLVGILIIKKYINPYYINPWHI